MSVYEISDILTLAENPFCEILTTIIQPRTSRVYWVTVTINFNQRGGNYFIIKTAVRVYKIMIRLTANTVPY